MTAAPSQASVLAALRGEALGLDEKKSEHPPGKDAVTEERRTNARPSSTYSNFDVAERMVGSADRTVSRM